MELTHAIMEAESLKSVGLTGRLEIQRRTKVAAQQQEDPYYKGEGGWDGKGKYWGLNWSKLYSMLL